MSGAKHTGTIAEPISGRSIQIRRMVHSDIPAAMRLKQAAGWNQTYQDWRRFLALEPRGSFVASHRKRVIGTVTTCVFDGVAWIGMMLVDPCYRRRGIATQLMQTALDQLDRNGCTLVYLDATEQGAPLYRRLGFIGQQEIVRVGGCPQALRCRDVKVTCLRPFRWQDWPSLRDLDQLASGTDRSKLLKRLLIERPVSSRVLCRSGRTRGFVFDRPGSCARLIGPIVALSEEVGRTLMATALLQARHTPTVIDIPLQNRAAMAVAEGAGLWEQRRFLRMVRGAPGVASSPHLWASSGPEKG